MALVVKSILPVKTTAFSVCIRHIQVMEKFYKKTACNYLIEMYFYNY